MFFDRFKQLCDENGISIYKAATDIGLNRAAANKWKSGSIPNGQTLTKLADYFGVTNDYLLGKEIESTLASSTLTQRDKRDIAKTMVQLMEQLADGDDLMFDGDPMTDEARASMLNAMQLGIEAAKVKNKARFTPKKFKKG